MVSPPFAIVPVEVCLDDRLTKMQLRVLIALLSFRAKGSDVVWPKRSKISERCGYKENVISRVTTDLCKLGWLEKSGKGGFSSSCNYRLTVPESVRVTEPKTVPEVVTTTVTEPETKPLPNRAPAINRPLTNHRTYQSRSAKKKESDKVGFVERVTDRSWATQ